MFWTHENNLAQFARLLISVSYGKRKDYSWLCYTTVVFFFIVFQLFWSIRGSFMFYGPSKIAKANSKTLCPSPADGLAITFYAFLLGDYYFLRAISPRTQTNHRENSKYDCRRTVYFLCVLIYKIATSWKRNVNDSLSMWFFLLEIINMDIELNVHFRLKLEDFYCIYEVLFVQIKLVIKHPLECFEVFFFDYQEMLWRVSFFKS